MLLPGLASENLPTCNFPFSVSPSGSNWATNFCNWTVTEWEINCLWDVGFFYITRWCHSNTSFIILQLANQTDHNSRMLTNTSLLDVKIYFLNYLLLSSPQHPEIKWPASMANTGVKKTKKVNILKTENANELNFCYFKRKQHPNAVVMWTFSYQIRRQE